MESFILKRGSNVIYRCISDSYEPCVVTLKKHVIFSERHLIVDPLNIDPTYAKLVSVGSFSPLISNCVLGGFYLFRLDDLNILNTSEMLLIIVHAGNVERI